MGEAKRRRALLGAEMPGVRIDYRTGEAVEAPVRYGGNAAAILERPGEVPCRGCTACCYHPFVDVYPEKERPEDLAHLDLVRREDGAVALRKRADGACVHLGAAGCTVYRHRPRACRRYDCRSYAMVGVLDRYDGDRTSPGWRFDNRTRRQRVLLVALEMAGRAAQTELSEGWDAEAALAAALKKLPAMFEPAQQMVDRLDGLSREEQAEVQRWLDRRTEYFLGKARAKTTEAEASLPAPARLSGA
jgi:hypothetical protein